MAAGKKKAKKASKAAKAKRAPKAKKTAKKAAKRTAKKARASGQAGATPKKATARKSVKAATKKAPAGKVKKIGEGDYAASRRFDKDEASFIKKNKANIPMMGRDAEKALEGPEGAALRDAEATAAARSRDIF